MHFNLKDILGQIRYLILFLNYMLKQKKMFPQLTRTRQRWRLFSLMVVMQLLSESAYSIRSVTKMTPVAGKNIYGQTFDYLIPDATWTDATKLSSVKFCTQNFYGIDLGTKIELTWSSGATFAQEAIQFNPTGAQCTTRNVVGEIGKVKVMLANSDQIQGLILVETAADYSITEYTLGSTSQNNPKTIYLDGPIIGVYGTYQLEFDGLQFYADKNYCYRSQINAFNLPKQTTILGTPIKFSLTPTSGAFHALGGNIYKQDPCAVKYVESSITNGLFTISGTTGTVGAKWADATKILAADVGQYYQSLGFSWTVTASYSTFLDIVTYQVVQKFDVLITPACNYSKITFASTTAVISDMTTPFYAQITQTLPTYTHEYATIWYTNPCIISTKVESGGSRLRKLGSDVIEAFSVNLADENTAITVTIKAYYSGYPDAASPTQFKLSPIKVTIEPRCNIKSFKAVSTVLPTTRYVLNYPMETVNFKNAFSFIDSCRLLQTYSAEVFQNGVKISPLFITFDQPNEKMQIYSATAADATLNNGFYDVQITSTLNLRDPNAIKVSQDTINFQLIISASPCLQTQIKTQSLVDMTYFIESQGGTNMDQLFSDFTDSVTLGTENGYLKTDCGAKNYKMTLSNTAATSVNTAVTLAITQGPSTDPLKQQKITINTIDMSTVGVYVATIFVTLVQFPQYDSIIGKSTKLTIYIENGCLHTKFKLTTPMPQMIQFIGSSTKQPVTAPLSPVPDSKSLTKGTLDGFSYCGDRLYTLVLKEIGSFVSQNSTQDVGSKEFTGNGPLWLNSQTMTLVLEGKEKSAIGRYTYELHVDLAQYQGPRYMDEIGVYPFNVYIIDDCADSKFTGFFPTDSHSLKIGQKPVIVQLGQNVQTTTKDINGNTVIKKAEIQVSVSTLYQALTGQADFCGQIEVSVGLIDHQPLPAFMVFDNSQNTIEIAPTRTDQIGQYEVALNYILSDYSTYQRYQQETFKVQLVLSTANHMPYLQKVIGFHTKVTLSIDEVFEFPLDIVDPDAFSWEIMRTTFTCNPQIDSFTFSNSTAESAKFSFKAQATDAGHTYRVDVQILDLGLTANYTWIIYVKMPTREQTQVLIDAVVKKQEKEVSIVVKTKNEVEGSFITQNTLPLVRAHDIEILRGLKKYPLPFIESIDRKGVIFVRFSRAIANCTNEEEIAKNILVVDKSINLELISGDTGDVIAFSSHNSDRNTNQVINQTTRRQLQSETVDANLLSWKITELNSEGFKLSFNLKEEVDSLLSAQNNVLKLIFNDGEKYLVDAQSGIRIGENRFYVAKVVVPKQLPEGEVSEDIVLVIGIISQYMQGAVIGVFVLGLIFNFPFDDFWIFLSFLVLLSHVILNRQMQHVYTELIYEMIMTVTRGDFFNIKQEIDKWLFNNWEFTSTGAYSTIFYTMQYKSRNVISNIGPFNLIFLLVSIPILLQIIFWPRICLFFKCSKGLTLRVKKWKPQTFIIRFFLLSFLVLGISALIPLSSYSDGQEGFTFMETKEQGGSKVDQILELYTYFVLVILGVFLIVTVAFSFSQARKLYKRSLLSQTSRRAALVLEILTGQKPKDSKIEQQRILAGYYEEDITSEQRLEKVKRRDARSEQQDQIVMIKLDDFFHVNPLYQNKNDNQDFESSSSITEIKNGNQVTDNFITEITSGDKTLADSSTKAIQEKNESLFEDSEPNSLFKKNFPGELTFSSHVDKLEDKTTQLYRSNLSRTDNVILMKHLGKFIEAAAKAHDAQSYIEKNRKLRTTSLEQTKKSPLLWTDIEDYQFFVEFLKGMRHDSKGIMFYYTLYLLRRSFLIVTLVFLHEFKALTIIIFLNLTFMSVLGHVVMQKPFLSQRANWLDRVCEIVIYMACMIQVIQIQYFEVADERAEIGASRALVFFGWANLVLVGIFCPLVTLMISGHTLFKLFRIIYYTIKAIIIWRRKKKAEAQRIEELKEEAIQNVAKKLAEEREAADLENAQNIGQSPLTEQKSEQGSILNTNSGMLDDSIKPEAKDKSSQLSLVSPRNSDGEDASSESSSQGQGNISISQNDRSVPDKEILEDDSLSVTNPKKKNKVVPETDESDKSSSQSSKSAQSAQSSSSEKLDIYSKSKIYQKKRDKMSEALKSLKKEVREKKAQLENEDVLYASEGEERGPGPAIQTAKRESLNTTFGAPPRSKRRPETQNTFSIEEEEDEEDSNEAPDKMIDSDQVINKNAHRLRAENKRKQTQIKPVDFMKMNDLEMMTDPYRRPSINTNEMILPLPTRNKHRRLQKRDEQINSIESLIEELDFTGVKDNTGPSPSKQEYQENVNIIDQFEKTMNEITSKKPYM